MHVLTKLPSGSHVFRVYPEGPHDQQWVHLVNHGQEVFADDFFLDGTHMVIVSGPKWYRFQVPSGASAGGDVDIGAPLNADDFPPVEYFVGAGPFVASSSGGTIYEMNPGQNTWRPLGNFSSPCAQCGVKRDFLSGGAQGDIVRALASCNTDPNAAMEATYATSTDGGVTSQCAIQSESSLSGISDTIVGVGPNGVAISGNKLYVGGVLKRNLRWCVSSGVFGAVGGVRSVQ